MPGTKWCGLGDQAKHYNDLGEYADVDRCCRDHDHCPTRMRSMRVAYGLMNFSLYTISHCRCDEAFYKCLKKTKSSLSDLIGNIYFNVMQTACIDTAKPCKSKFDPFCADSIFFKGRPKSEPRIVFVPNKLEY
uniref:Phospholipase A2 n=2 Tax=Tetranychus urticae TaxID=32264 RepID=T1KPN2_TETUR